MPEKAYGLYYKRSNGCGFAKKISFSERAIKEYLFNKISKKAKEVYSNCDDPVENFWLTTAQAAYVIKEMEII